MNLGCTAKCLRAGLGQSDVPNLPFLNQFSHCSYGFLDRSIGIDAVLIIKIDVIHAEPLQTFVNRFTNVVGLAAHTARFRIVRVANDTKFRGYDNFVALAAQCASHQFFVFERSIDVSSIEKVQSKFDTAMNCGDGFSIVAEWPVELRHTHAAEPKSGNTKAAAAKFAELHLHLLCLIFSRFRCARPDADCYIREKAQMG